MNNEELKKALDKIAKCMRLTASSEPHEAAAALRQAQALMRKFNLTEEDLKAHKYGNELVDTPVQSGARPQVPIQLSMLCRLITRAFGVQIVTEKTLRVSDRNYSFRIFGLEHRVPLAAYTFRIVFKAMEDAWKQYLKEHSGLKQVRGMRASFQTGWLKGVIDKIDATGFSDEEKIELNLVKEKHYGRSLVRVTSGTKSLYSDPMSAGKNASASFNLYRPMNDAANRKLLR